MNNENKFILELCKSEYAQKEKLMKQMDGNLDYPYILGQLLYHRVGSIAYHTLKQNELLHKVNREFRNSLKTIYEYNSQKTESYVEILNVLKPMCEKFNFPYAFLKGAYLVELYQKGLRTSNDIDILIESENITELTKILKTNGFKQGNIRNEIFIPASRKEIISSRMNRGETVPFVKEVNYPNMRYLEIDINFSLGFKPGVDESIVSEFLNCTKPLILDTVSTLNRIDFLIHLCAHLYKEATVMKWVEMGRDISLYKYCDIYLFLHKFINKKFRTELIQRIGDVRLNKECYYALYYVKELFDFDNKDLDLVLKEIQPTDVSFMSQVLEPQTGKVYFYDMRYGDWVFCSNRKGNLYETGNVEE